MTTKLTLSIEKDVIERAKATAENLGLSISYLVQKYLESLATSQVRNTTGSKLINSMQGAFKSEEIFDYKNTLTEELVKKHL